MKITAKRLFDISKLILILTALLSVFKISAFAETWFYDSFENEESLSGWIQDEGQSVQISTERYKIDKSSLKWSYKNGGKLKLTGCSAFSNFKSYKAGHGIKLWIYSTNKTDADMTIKIGSSANVENRPSYRFNVNMNFEGWRCVWARVNDFARTGYSNDGADTLMIVMPEDMGEGALYLDSFEITDYVHYAACSDFQITNIPTTNTTYQYASYLKIPQNIEGTECTSEQMEAFKIIKKRFDDYIIDEETDYASLDSSTPEKIRYNQTLSRARSYINTHKKQTIVRREDGSIDAVGLTSSQDSVGTKIASYEKIWVSLALDWKINKNEESREKLLELFDYFYEQGWAEGSSMGAMRFDEIRVDGYAFAVYMMKEELKETGRWERELANLKWRSEFGMVFAYDDPEIAHLSSVDADKMRSVVLFQLMYILCMEDSPEKVAYMKAYTKYFNDIVAPRHGSDGGIKNDYTIWHHTSPYMSAYGAEAINILCKIKYLLSGTCFDTSDEATAVLKKSLDVYRVSADKYDMPIRVRGRFPNSNNTMVNVTAAYAFLAASGDNESARIFLDLWDETNSNVSAVFTTNPMPSITYLNTIGQYTFYNEVKEKALSDGLLAAEMPEGVHVFPYGGYAVARIGNTMAAVGGFSKYIWDYEGSTSENFYGRYMNYGSLTLTNKDGFVNSGINTEKGWDWSRFPGTTAKKLTNEELEHKTAARYLSDETFLGGVSRGKSGVYAMKLHDTYFDSSFHANKSYFFFDDRIICLGSDISNSDTGHNTETTLFQNVMTDSSTQTVGINGKEVAEMEFIKKDFEGGAYLTDAVGNGYVIPDANGLVVERCVNESNANKGAKSTGEISLAYINHQSAPDNTGYEYVVLPEADEEKTVAVFKNPGYEVIKKDSDAHIVKDTNKSEVGYAVFNGGAELSGGVVKSASAPCVIMESRVADGLKLSFQDPDLRIVTSGTIKELLSPSEEKATEVVLSGIWEIVNGNDKVSIVSASDNTTLEFICSDGKQLDVELAKVMPEDGSIELCKDDEIFINEDFSSESAPVRGNKGAWTFSGASRFFDGDVFTSLSRGTGIIQLDTAVTVSNEPDSTNRYVLEFDVTRMGNADGTSQCFYPEINGSRYSDLKMTLSEDGKTYGINMTYQTKEGTRELVSGIAVGEFITIRIVYDFGGDYITMDISAKNSEGELIGNQFKDYKICDKELSSSGSLDKLYFVNYVTDESIKFDNVQFYKYKINNEIMVSKLAFSDINGELVSLDNVKKNEQVFCMAEFNAAEGIAADGIFAVYDENERLVSTKCVELLKGQTGFERQLFTADTAGSYKVKLFLWEDTDEIVPIKGVYEFSH